MVGLFVLCDVVDFGGADQCCLGLPGCGETVVGVSAVNAYHCDAEGCDVWQRSDADVPVFHTLIDPEDGETHFCSLKCAMLWAAAHSSPMEGHEIP